MALQYGSMATNIEELQDITAQRKAELNPDGVPSGYVGMSTEKGVVFVPIMDTSKYTASKGSGSKTPAPSIPQKENITYSPDYKTTMTKKEQEKTAARQKLLETKAKINYMTSKPAGSTPTMTASFIRQKKYGNTSKSAYGSPTIPVNIESSVQGVLRERELAMDSLPSHRFVASLSPQNPLFNLGRAASPQYFTRQERVRALTSAVMGTSSTLNMAGVLGTTGTGAVMWASGVTNFLASDPTNPRLDYILLDTAISTYGAIHLWKGITALKDYNVLVKTDKPFTSLKRTDMKLTERGGIDVEAKITGQSDLGKLLKMPRQEIYNIKGSAYMIGETESGKGIIKVVGDLYSVGGDEFKAKMGQKVLFELSDDQIRILNEGKTIKFGSVVRSEMDYSVGKGLKTVDIDSSAKNMMKQTTIETPKQTTIETPKATLTETITSTKITGRMIDTGSKIRVVSLADDIKRELVTNKIIPKSELSGVGMGLGATVDDVSIAKGRTITFRGDNTPGSVFRGDDVVVSFKGIKTTGDIATKALEKSLSKSLETAIKPEVIKGTATQPIIISSVGKSGVSVKDSGVKESEIKIDINRGSIDMGVKEEDLFDTRSLNRGMVGTSSATKTRQADKLVSRSETVTINDSAFRTDERQTIGSTTDLNLGQIGKMDSKQETKLIPISSRALNTPTGLVGFAKITPIGLDFGLPDIGDLLPSVRNTRTPSYRGRRRSGYTPTLSAIEFNISLDVPSGFNEDKILGSGLGLRPLLRTRPKPKKRGKSMAKKKRKSKRKK